jgi:protoporphyrinogen oxidase
MAIEKILVPYNFSAQEEKALDFIVRTYANRDDVQVTLFNAYTSLPTVDMQAGPEMAKMKMGLARLSDEIREKEAGLKSAKEFLVRNGLKDDQVDYIFKEKEKSTADEIIYTVSKHHYRVLVLSRQLKVGGLFGRSIHTKVLSTLKNITACIVT